jgi:hypothetical protein
MDNLENIVEGLRRINKSKEDDKHNCTDEDKEIIVSFNELFWPPW